MNKRYFFFLSMLVLLLGFNGYAQIETKVDASPFTTAFSQPNPVEATWDVKFDWNLQTLTGGALGHAGVVYIPTLERFWVSRWASAMILVFTKTGALVDSFTLGVTGTRGMAFDGQYVYHSVNTATLQKVDPVTRTIVGTVPLPSGVTARFITYDPTANSGAGGFWVGNWNSGALNYFLVSKTGTQLAVIQNTAITGTYGVAFDQYSVGGPFLWVWSQGAGAGTPQNIIQLSIATGLPTGVQHDVASDVGLGNAQAIAGGMFITPDLLPGYVVMGGVMQGTPDKLFGYELKVLDAGTLLPFNLTSPAAGATLTSFPNSNTLVTVTWDTSRAAATYKWIFGSPTTATRLFEVPVGTNKFEITLGQLDQLLAAFGVQPGQSVVGQWDVWAFRNNMPQNDSLKAANGPRAITLTRGVPQLTAFNLLAPENNTTIITSAFNNSPINISWSASGEGVTYKWKFGTTLKSFAPVLVLPSSNNGYGTNLTVVNSSLDAILSGLGIQPGQSTTGQWTVYAYSGSDSLKATQTWNITFQRQAKGDVLVAYDSTAANGRISKDSVTAYLGANNITFDLFNKGTQTSTNVISFRGYKKIIWLGEGTSVMSVVQKDSIKAFLSNPTEAKSKLMIFAEDLGYQFGRSGSTYLDVDFCNNYLGFNFVADRPPSGAAQGLTWDYMTSVTNHRDSTIGTWPDVLALFNPAQGHNLVKFDDGTYNAIGFNTPTSTVYVQAVDVESMRRSFASPEGSAHARSLFYGMAYVDNNGIIPVELTSFTAKANDNVISLEWSTATEVNNKGFEIERSIDNAPFTVVAFIEGKGTSSETQAYRFTDNASVSGNYTYRLRQIDFDGTFKLSDEVSVDVIAPVEFSLSQNYPNPFNPSTTIKFGLAADSKVSLKIYNTLGQEVMTILNNELKSGTHEVNFNASVLSSGVYFYEINAQGLNGTNFSSVKKMMLMK